MTNQQALLKSADDTFDGDAKAALPKASVSGGFVDRDGERWYAIRNVNRLRPFFISVVSSADHWLFVSSNGGLTAGRVSPEQALFPYKCVTELHDGGLNTGPRTVVRIGQGHEAVTWEPFNPELYDRFELRRNLYKTALGHKLCFEEVNHDLGLAFRYTWATSEQFGFVRQCVVENLGTSPLQIELLDGLQNLLPAGTPRMVQQQASNLVDAYRMNALDPATGIASYALCASITDRAEPSESLKANVVWCTGFDAASIALSSSQLADFRAGASLASETSQRGVRGAFLIGTAFQLPANEAKRWAIVANVEQTQSQLVALQHLLAEHEDPTQAVANSIADGGDQLARIVASNDAAQCTADEACTTHHHANVLFNVMRGGYFPGQSSVDSKDFAATVAHFNRPLHRTHHATLKALPSSLSRAEFLKHIDALGDAQLRRLALEYLPITFGRRHGDPSRPWNQFAIQIKDDHGQPLLSYQGNWRDIFQNWEALAFSTPEFLDGMIAKFVNASTVDGYNPYRITKQGIDWEAEDPDDPWSYIGYWGDHQIIYLLKLLEATQRFHPERLHDLLHETRFGFANVPYRIRDFDALVADPKSTVDFDHQLAARIEKLEADLGSDARLVHDANGRVVQVTLLEKLLIPLLAKLGNLVIDGGIWMNTQRPEWNDANNALVGQGLSMVTLYYLRRYVSFFNALLSNNDQPALLTSSVSRWLADTTAALEQAAQGEEPGTTTPRTRLLSLRSLGEAAAAHRQRAYAGDGLKDCVEQPISSIRNLLTAAQQVFDASIANNQRDDGLYHAYNTVQFGDQALHIDHLQLMLEGQVAVLSSGAIGHAEALKMLEALYASGLYREDQHSFLLYPDRELPDFLAKNQIPADQAAGIPLVARLLADDNRQIIQRDAAGAMRFAPGMANARALDAALNELPEVYADAVTADRAAMRALYEAVFVHRNFTGRSGTMFGFEGLGCIYWHMVAKLLLTIQERYFAAVDDQCDTETTGALGAMYYRVRRGIGFNKTPAEYGAFPTDPYSHTPGDGGARQPGMTGQVKEEVLTRFGELGVRVQAGTARFDPRMLRAKEFIDEARDWRVLDGQGQWSNIVVPAGSLGFTWCQVPVIYQLDDQCGSAGKITLTLKSGEQIAIDGLTLPAEHCPAIFQRTGHVRRIDVTFGADLLLQI